MGLRGSKEEKDEQPEDQADEQAVPSAPSRPDFAGGTPELLTASQLEWLHASLPAHPRPSVWTSLYASRRDGKSFSKLVGSIVNKGPTLILVRDTEGHVFGGYCRDDWKDSAAMEKELAKASRRAEWAKKHGKEQEQSSSLHPKADANFYGTPTCCLVSVHPERAIYRPTGMNGNFMYLQTNWPEQHKNGLVMGGLPNLFGMHLDHYLDKGHFGRGKCITFNSPCLAASNDFTIEEVEAWGLSDRALESHAEKASILKGKDIKADKVILESAGRKFYSEE